MRKSQFLRGSILRTFQDLNSNKFKFISRQFCYTQNENGKWGYKPKQVLHFDNKEYLKLYEMDYQTYCKLKYLKPALLSFLIALALYKLYNFKQRRWYGKIFYFLLLIGSSIFFLNLRNNMLKCLAHELYLSKSGNKIKVNTILNRKLQSIYIEDIENMSDDYEINEEVAAIHAYNQIYVFDCDPERQNLIVSYDILQNICCGRNIIIDNDFKDSSVIDIKFNQFNNEKKS